MVSKQVVFEFDLYLHSTSHLKCQKIHLLGCSATIIKETDKIFG